VTNSMRAIGSLGFATLMAFAAPGCDPDICESADCCVDECCGEDCNPAVFSGVATPWESVATRSGAAPSGTLLIKLSSGEGFCAEPWVSEFSCSVAGAWEVEVPLPPALQYAGAVVALDQLEELGAGPTIISTTGTDEGCVEGVLLGNLEVVAIDEFSVEVRFTEISPSISELEGSKLVPRCQNPDLPQQAVALNQSQLDSLYAARIAGGSGAGGGDAAPEPITEPLHLFIDRSEPAEGALCADPLARLGECSDTRATLEVVLGIDNQFPGTFAIGDSVSVSELTTASGALCSSEAAPWTVGSVEVVAITPTLVHVKVDGGAQGVVDAVATRCF
jgi:hypothetical protein